VPSRRSGSRPPVSGLPRARSRRRRRGLLPRSRTPARVRPELRADGNGCDHGRQPNEDRRDFGVGARRNGCDCRRALGAADGDVFGEWRTAVLLVLAGSRHVTGGSRRLTAALHLFEPCSDASATTVDVAIDQSRAGSTVSPTTVPCGTVTFDVTDVDTANARLLVSAQAPPRSGLTTQLNPGGTATLRSSSRPPGSLTTVPSRSAAMESSSSSERARSPSLASARGGYRAHQLVNPFRAPSASPGAGAKNDDTTPTERPHSPQTGTAPGADRGPVHT